jgi:ATP-binding cassette, subfamily B, bacterial MsbA
MNLLVKFFELFLPRQDQAIIARLLREKWRSYAPRYAIAFAFMFIVAGTTALSAWLMKDVINKIFVERDQAAVIWLPFVVIVLYMAKGAATYFQEVTMARIGNRMIAETQKRMFSRVVSQDMAYFGRTPSSDLITRLTHNAQATRDVVQMLATSLGRDLVTLGGLVAVMVIQQPIMFLICTLGAPIGIFMQKNLIKRIQKVTRREVLSHGHIVATMRETAQGIRVVKAFTLEKAMQERMDAAIDRVEERNNKLIAINARSSPVVDTLGGFAFASVIFYAGWRALYHGDTPGEFFSFITALLLAYEPARRLSRLQVKLAQGAIGVRMMFELIDAEPGLQERPDATDLTVQHGEVRYEDVTFAYRTGEPVLKELSLIAAPGKTTALVGLSGSGKTTLMNLILRFWDPASGRVLIDGQDIKDVRLASLRSKISLVSQDVFLFDGTIRDNIRAGLEGATDAEVVAAAKAAYAHHFIEAMPLGYDTQVGELGAQLSGGQRQRISIARAFLKNAPIILLDEPTSALDSESEQAIQRALTQLTERRTTLVIAHRLATILNADCIYVVDSGKVAESGTHAQLLKQNGIYSRLYEIQFAPNQREAV